MEPVSTLIIASFVAVTATARPRWDPPRVMGKEPDSITLVETPPQIIRTLTAPARLPSTLVTETVPPDEIPFYSLKEILIKEINAYKPDYPGSDPGIVSNIDDIETALSFIQKLPSGIALPVLMRSDDGQIGMYWDNDNAYIDINIDPGSTLSLFSRARSTGKETFIDNIPISAIDAHWAFEHLGLLTKPHTLAA